MISTSQSIKEDIGTANSTGWKVRDPCWNSSILPWHEWTPKNGYTEQGCGFEAVPVKLVAAVQAIYVLLVFSHVTSVFFLPGVYTKAIQGTQPQRKTLAINVLVLRRFRLGVKWSGPKKSSSDYSLF